MLTIRQNKIDSRSMLLNRLLMALSICSLFAQPLFAAPPKKETDLPPKELARVAILTYDDETNTQNFGYMPTSLTEAIDKSLQQRFEYVREEPQKSEEQRRKIKAQGIFTAKEAAQYCAKYDVQIIVYGRFTYDEPSKQIVVETWISLGTEKDHRKLKERRNPTDASIFNLADKVAEDIVSEMTLIALEQKKSQSKPVAKGEKLELEKKVAPQFSPYKSMVSLGPGATFAIFDFSKGYHDSPTVSATFRYNFFPRWYGVFSIAGAESQGRNSENSASFEMNLRFAPIKAGLGYSWLFGKERWRFNAEAVVGVYLAKFTILNNGEQVFEKNFVNPLFGVGSGLHYLLFTRIAVGVQAGYLELLDKDASSARMVIIELVVSYVF